MPQTTWHHRTAVSCERGLAGFNVRLHRAEKSCVIGFGETLADARSWAMKTVERMVDRGDSRLGTDDPHEMDRRGVFIRNRIDAAISDRARQEMEAPA